MQLLPYHSIRRRKISKASPEFGSLVQETQVVESPYITAIYNFGHLNVLGGQQPLRLLNRLLPYVGHRYLCDNDGKCTRHESRGSKHMPLGEWTMDWWKVLGRCSTAVTRGGWTWTSGNTPFPSAQARRASKRWTHSWRSDSDMALFTHFPRFSTFDSPGGWPLY